MMHKFFRFLLLALVAISLQGAVVFGAAYAGCAPTPQPVVHDAPCHGDAEMEQQMSEKRCCQDMTCLKCMHFSVLAAKQAAIAAPSGDAVLLSFGDDGLKDSFSFPFERPPKTFL